MIGGISMRRRYGRKSARKTNYKRGGRRKSSRIKKYGSSRGGIRL